MAYRTKRSAIAPEACHLAHAIDLIGDRWSLLILRSALFGVRRFDDFQAELDIPRTVLSGRLRRLVEGGLLEKSLYQETGKRRRTEYVLSLAGQALQPTLMALTQWSDKWLLPDRPAPLSLRHRTTREEIEAGFLDPSGQRVHPDQIRIAYRR
ncbi:MAG: winged helix-turn-helix transcriptional regulator [Henriciella sp.]|jgi:DNA-binding HxlR family transcriptional regulator